MSSKNMIDGQGSVVKTGIDTADHQPGAINLVKINRIALATILRKEIRRFSRIWVQTIVPPAINAVLYMLIFGSLIGSRISDMGGFRYIDFIVPGIIMMSVIINSYSNVVSSFFSSKMQNYIEELLVSPVSSITIVIGYVGGGMARGLLVGILVATVSLLFSEILMVFLVLQI
jgi:ABC-2 type transport system permease protein